MENETTTVKLNSKNQLVIDIISLVISNSIEHGDFTEEQMVGDMFMATSILSHMAGLDSMDNYIGLLKGCEGIAEKASKQILKGLDNQLGEEL